VYSLLLRSLYGLKQAANNWNHDFDQENIRLKMTPSTMDPCFYFNKDPRGWLLLVGHVDDCIGAADNVTVYQEFVNDFKFPLSVIEVPLQYVLKVNIKQDADGIKMSQVNYIDDMSDKFNVTNANGKSTPMEIGAVLDKRQMPEVGSEEHKEMQEVPYRGLMGALLYSSICRPDIKGALSKLGHFMCNPARVHWKALKRCLIYLKTTKHLCMVIGSQTKTAPILTVHVDADHAGDRGTGKSTSGIVVKFRGSTIDATSKRQGSVANSTGAAELMALAMAVKKVIVFRHTLEELDYVLPPTDVYTDAQVVVDMLKKGTTSEKMKHISVAFYEVKDLITKGKIVVHHIPGVDNPADILTKPLPRETFEKHRLTLLNNHFQVNSELSSGYKDDNI
jgi:ribonuclease HI